MKYFHSSHKDKSEGSTFRLGRFCYHNLIIKGLHDWFLSLLYLEVLMKAAEEDNRKLARTMINASLSER